MCTYLHRHTCAYASIYGIFLITSKSLKEFLNEILVALKGNFSAQNMPKSILVQNQIKQVRKG